MKKVKLYATDMIFFVIVVMIFIHLAMLGFCIYFYYHFLVESYDPDAYILIFILLGMLIPLDVIEYRDRLYVKLFVRCNIDAEGIFCYGFCIKSWYIPWDKVRTYGIAGHYDPSKPFERATTPHMFFSLDPDEPWDRKSLYRLNKNRVLFQMRDEIWPKMSEYMPKDMVKVLQYADDNDRNCFGRR